MGERKKIIIDTDPGIGITLISFLLDDSIRISVSSLSLPNVFGSSRIWVFTKFSTYCYCELLGLLILNLGLRDSGKLEI